MTTKRRKKSQDAWSRDARSAMRRSPNYFVWWYTLKSLGLVVAAGTAAYYIGKQAGAQQAR